MPLRFLIDEDTRDDAYRNAINSHNELNPDEPIDAVRVGDPHEDVEFPQLGASDDSVISWASRNDRVLVSQDANTLIQSHTQFIHDGGRTAGIVILISKISPGEFAEYLCLLAYATWPNELSSQVKFIPEPE